MAFRLHVIPGPSEPSIVMQRRVDEMCVVPDYNDGWGHDFRGTSTEDAPLPAAPKIDGAAAPPDHSRALLQRMSSMA
jgi:hypothetical protein